MMILCQREDETSQATTWCYDCSDALCDQCKGFHMKVKLLAKHRTVSINDVKEEEIAASKLNIDTNCDLHPGESLKLYCEPHSKFCCCFCVVEAHKECQYVVSLDEIAQRLKDQETYRITEYSKIKAFVKKSINEIEVNLKELDQEKASLLSSASKLVIAGKTKLDKLYADFETIVHRKYENFRQTQKKSLEALNKFCDNIGKCTNDVHLLRHVPKKESVVMMEKIRQKTEKHLNQMTEILKKDSNVKLKFKPDSTMTMIMKTLSTVGEAAEKTQPLKSLRDLSSIEEIIKSLDVKLLTTTQAQFPVNKTLDLLTADVHLVKVINVSDLNLNGRPYFFDGTFVADNNCLFTDINNSRLVLLNDDLQVKSEIKVEKNPAGITLSQDKTGVYVVCNYNSVLLYSLLGDNKLIRRINIEFFSCGVCLSGDTIITGHYNSVLLCDLHGNKRNTISTQGYVYCIAVSNDGSRFYHGDGDQIVCRDVSSCTEIFRHQNKDLIDPRSICVDNDDNLYVVGMGSENIHQISHDGHRHRVIVDKMNKMEQPFGIVFHPTRPMFIVTSPYEATAMEVYEFS